MITTTPHRQLEDQRIKQILNNKGVYFRVHADLVHILTQLGLADNIAKTLSDQILNLYLSSLPITEIDEKAYTLIAQSGVLPKYSAMREIRREDVFKQTAKYLTDVSGKIIDYGAGDGQNAQILHDRLGVDISGVDVRDAKAANITIPMIKFDGISVPVSDKYFTVGIVSHVLHHETNNEQILRELDRLVSRRLIIRESIPCGNNENEMMGNMDRMYMGDYFSNRLFVNYLIPVPGTFETLQGWKTRFAKYGWRCTHEENCGPPTPFISQNNFVFIFERDQVLT
jgi:ubiquinone/menaquinone biosynthesis C-methylase UbiE